MNDFLTILEEHRSLYEERGYVDIGLGTFEQPGPFMQQLEKGFSDCIKNVICLF
jgi:hypothetical protein